MFSSVILRHAMILLIGVNQVIMQCFARRLPLYGGQGVWGYDLLLSLNMLNYRRALELGGVYCINRGWFLG